MTDAFTFNPDISFSHDRDMTLTSAATRITKLVAGIMLVGTLTTLPAHAVDDPLQPIKDAIERDRNNACPNSGILGGDKKLEAIAQAYARSEDLTQVTPPPEYNRLLPFLGSGDPETQAINKTYKQGAGQVIGKCGEYAYGVGFVRHPDRSVDVVTIVFGELKPPLHPASIRLTKGAGSFYIAGSGFSQNTVVSITFNYFPGSGVTTNSDNPTTTHTDSSGNFATIVTVPTLLNPTGRLDVEAKDSVFSTRKSN